MIMKLHWIIYLLVVTILFSCKKKDMEYNPTPTSTNVEFYFQGRINNVSTTIEAGKNDYYMYSRYDYDTSIATYWFEGMFKKINCYTNCPNTLKILISDDTINSNGNPSHINQLVAGNYAYYMPTSIPSISSFQMNIYAVPIYSASTLYKYYLDGNLIGTTPNISNYNISATTHTLTCIMDNYTDSCYNNVLTNIINLTPTDSFYAFYQYSANTSSDTVSFYIVPSAYTSNSYTLNFGDGNSAVTTNTMITHIYASSSTTYTAQLITKSNNGKIFTFSNFITLNPYTMNCLPNYYFKFSPIVSPNTPYSKIKIEYISATGNAYSSAINSQPSTSYFQIISIEDYKLNENNQPTKKIKAQLKVRVFNVANPNDYLDIDGNVIFAVSYK